ncbi:MAG: TerY-C metal binding domain-containing protein [Fimbriiglobus sp.]
MIRRLPIYLVLDVSESMAGPAIEAVERGVQTMVDALKSDPMALETVYLSVITFAREAKQIVPLTELMKFVAPPLSVRAGSAMGAGLKLLAQCIKRDVVRTTATTKGDYKPLVFLLTDGQPTDDYESALESLSNAGVRVANLYAIGCGPDVDPAVLREVSDIALMLKDLTPEGFRKCFLWLSASAQMASMRPDAHSTPPTPAGMFVPDENTPFDSTPRQVFLAARCRKSGKPYLMRFARRPYDSAYEAISAHKMEQLESDAGSQLPPVNSSDLDGCPPCPYCENPIAGACSCGTIFCSKPNDRGPIICPGCKEQLTMSGGGESFDIRRSMG